MKDPSERFKVWPTNVDRTAFQTVMEAGGLAAVIQAYPGLRGRQKATCSPLGGGLRVLLPHD